MMTQKVEVVKTKIVSPGRIRIHTVMLVEKKTEGLQISWYEIFIIRTRETSKIEKKKRKSERMSLASKWWWHQKKRTAGQMCKSKMRSTNNIQSITTIAQGMSKKSFVSTAVNKYVTWIKYSIIFFTTIKNFFWYNSISFQIIENTTRNDKNQWKWADKHDFEYTIHNCLYCDCLVQVHSVNSCQVRTKCDCH